LCETRIEIVHCKSPVFKVLLLFCRVHATRIVLTLQCLNLKFVGKVFLF
jgi:hypothetical protein